MYSKWCFSNHIMASTGCSSRFLLWEADLPSVQLERSGWFVGVCVSDRHSGLAGFHWRKQDPGHPQSPTPATNTTPTEVHSVLVCVYVSVGCYLVFGLCGCIYTVCVCRHHTYRNHPTLFHISLACL